MIHGPWCFSIFLPPDEVQLEEKIIQATSRKFNQFNQILAEPRRVVQHLHHRCADLLLGFSLQVPMIQRNWVDTVKHHHVQVGNGWYSYSYPGLIRQSSGKVVETERPQTLQKVVKRRTVPIRN